MGENRSEGETSPQKRDTNSFMNCDGERDSDTSDKGDSVELRLRNTFNEGIMGILSLSMHQVVQISC